MKARAGLMLAACLLAGGSGAGRAADLAGQCAAAGNDDTLRPYTPALDAGVRQAFRILFPHAPAPSSALLAEQTHLRCMDGRVYACFTGANLPCDKIETSRSNPGADAYCRTQPDAGFVPAYATGHGNLYTWRCRSGRAEVSGRAFKALDPRGFAARLWAPVN
jgi:hypothetical protein